MLEADLGHHTPPFRLSEAATSARPPEAPSSITSTAASSSRRARCASRHHPLRARPAPAAPRRRSDGKSITRISARGAIVPDPRGNGRAQVAVVRAHQPASEQDLDRLLQRGRAGRWRPRQGDDLRRQAVDHSLARRRRRLGLGEDDRRQLDEPLRGEPAADGSPRATSAGVARPKWAETARSSVVAGPRPSAPRAAAPRRGEADVLATAPVPADRPESGKADLAAVRTDPDAVDPRAADDRHAPAPLGARRSTAKVSLATATLRRPVPRSRSRRGARSSSAAGRRRPSGSRRRRRRPRVRVERGASCASRTSRSESTSTRALEPEALGRAARAADRGEHAPVGSRPARGRSSSCRRRRRGVEAPIDPRLGPALSVPPWTRCAHGPSLGRQRLRRGLGGGQALEQLGRQSRIVRSADGRAAPAGPVPRSRVAAASAVSRS